MNDKLKNQYDSLMESLKEDCEDCDDLTSPCCNANLHRVFGELPLKVLCGKCAKQYLLRDLIK